MLDHIELFCGLGGFRLGLGEYAVTMAAVEKNPKSMEVYNNNFSDQVLNCRVEDFDPRGFPCDLITASLPSNICGSNAASSSEKRDQCGEILKGFLKCVHISNCQHVIFEGPRDFGRQANFRNRVINELHSLGFQTVQRILSAERFGLPQRREKFFIIASRSGIPQLPSSTVDRQTVREILEHDIENKYAKPNFYLSQKRIEGMKKHKTRHVLKGHGFGFSVLNLDTQSHALITGGMGLSRNIIKDPDNERLRFFTPRECARLQGFPDSYVLPKAKSVSYALLAESTPPPFVSAIINANGEWLK